MSVAWLHCNSNKVPREYLSWSRGFVEHLTVLCVPQETIAVTHNFVSSAGLPAVLAFLKTGRADLVSGCAEDERADLHDRFISALREERPQVSACGCQRVYMLLKH